MVQVEVDIKQSHSTETHGNKLLFDFENKIDNKTGELAIRYLKNPGVVSGRGSENTVFFSVVLSQKALNVCRSIFISCFQLCLICGNDAH